MRVELVGERAERLDAFVASKLPGVPRRRIAAALREGVLLVNGRRSKPGAPVRAGDRIEGEVPAPAIAVEPEAIEMRILHEDDDIVVIDKPRGLLSQATRFEPRRNVAAALLARYGSLPSLGGPERAGIVHRLDREVGGAMVCGRTEAALRDLSRQFRERTVEKEYWAAVEGRVTRTEFMIDAPLGLAKRRWRAKVSRRGKPSVTRVVVRERRGKTTILSVFPQTGRPHQIRAHLASIGHPIVGDPVYGRAGELALHAVRLAFHHPTTGERLVFRSPVPREAQPGPTRRSESPPDRGRG
jgi:23S rRNA pseudouridine1911/1915/1917 synthase